MKKTLFGIAVFALASATVRAQHNPGVAYSTSDCPAPPPHVTLAAVSPNPIVVSLGGTVSAGTTATTNGGPVRLISVDEYGNETHTIIGTNYPTIVSNWTVVYWNNQSTTNAGLSVFFTPANTGSGTITFYSTYTNPSPCQPGPFTASQSVTVMVLSPPVITTQPTNQAVNEGASVTLTVTAAGSSPLAYQWLFNGTSLSGATGTAYSITAAQTNNAGNYAVVVTNLVGSVTSADAALLCIPAAWLIQYFGANYLSDPNAAPYADPDHDGVPNYLEYLLFRNPIVPGAGVTNLQVYTPLK